jgi:hypothetical protein
MPTRRMPPPLDASQAIRTPMLVRTDLGPVGSGYGFF